jgi:tetratricopeptide (TPR) repeat protein
LALHDTSALFATYQQALKIRDDAPWVTMGIARAHFMARDLDAASRIAQEMIALHPNYVAAYELLAQIKTKQGDDSAALELLQDSSKILPSAKRYRAISESAFLLGQLDEAKQHSEMAIKLSSGSMAERSDDHLALAQIQTDQGDARGAINTLEKNARKYVETGSFGIAKNAILAQAYFDSGETEKAKKLVERAHRLVNPQTDSSALTSLGKAAIKTGNLILGLEVMTRAIQASGAERQRIARHVTKAMQDTGQVAKIAEVIDAGQRRIMILVDEAARLMRSAHFEEAYQKVLAALEIHDENIEALLAAAQLHLLWLKQDGMNTAIITRAKAYLSTLDKLVPNNERVMGFYRFFNELTGA